jgi:hypothetical protein
MHSKVNNQKNEKTTTVMNGRKDFQGMHVIRGL